MQQLLFFFVFTRIFEEALYENASGTRINVNYERSLTLTIHNFSIGIGNGITGASLTVEQMKFPQIVRILTDRATVSLWKFFSPWASK